jgi:branched-chain amino acid transport system substrate-binding protein
MLTICCALLEMSRGPANATMMAALSGSRRVTAITEKIGKFDSKALAAALHGAKISAKDNPGVLLDVSFDQKGDLDRESFIVKVVGGKQQVIATVPAIGTR